MTYDEYNELDETFKEHLEDIIVCCNIQMIYGIEVTPNQLKLHKSPLGRLFLDDYVVDMLDRHFERSDDENR